MEGLSRWLVSNDRIWRPRANPTNRVARRWPHEPQNRSVDQIRSARDRSLALSDERAAKDTAHLASPVRSASLGGWMISAMDETRKPAGEWAAIGTLGVDPAGSDGRSSPLSAPQTRAPGLGRRRRSSRHGLTSSLSWSTTWRAATTRPASVAGPPGHAVPIGGLSAGDMLGTGVRSRVRMGGHAAISDGSLAASEAGGISGSGAAGPLPCSAHQARKGPILIGGMNRRLPRLRRHPAGCARRPPVPPSPARWCARAGDRGWVLRRRSRPTRPAHSRRAAQPAPRLGRTSAVGARSTPTTACRPT